MAEYLKIQINGQITLPPAICRAANIKEGDLLEAVVEEDGSIHLIPMGAEMRKLMEQSQLVDVNWALKQKLD